MEVGSVLLRRMSAPPAGPKSDVDPALFPRVSVLVNQAVGWQAICCMNHCTLITLKMTCIFFFYGVHKPHLCCTLSGCEGRAVRRICDSAGCTATKLIHDSSLKSVGHNNGVVVFLPDTDNLFLTCLYRSPQQQCQCKQTYVIVQELIMLVPQSKCMHISEEMNIVHLIHTNTE